MQLQRPKQSNAASLMRGACGLWMFLAFAACTAPQPPTQAHTHFFVHDTATTENGKQGTLAWQLTNPIQDKNDHSLEGYASAASVNQGLPIDLFINAAGDFTLQVF